MKKTITLLIPTTFFLVFSAKSQINKGSILLGGTLNAYSDNVKNSDSNVFKQNYFSVSPSIGFAIDVNTVLGFSLSYSTNTSNGYSSFKTKNNGYSAGVFLRKYKPLSQSFYLFGESNSFKYFSGYCLHFNP